MDTQEETVIVKETVQETVEETVEETVVEDSTMQESEAEQDLQSLEESNKTLLALEALPDLLEKLALDNTQYELHVQLIETLKQAELPDELESARQNMHRVYPLTEGLWLDWINDAKKEASTEQGRSKLLRLYEEAQEDYLSINIWKSYVEYILGDFHAIFNETVTEESEEITEFIELTRQDLLKAVSKTMYHIKDSQQIWKPYSEFELKVLNKFKTPYQLERVKNMFIERLQVLHIDCEDTFSAYSSFVTTWDNANYEKILSETNKLYAKTKRAAEERDVFEMKLVSNGYTLDSFYEYIENEKLTKLMPLINNVRCLYERAIVYYCTDPNLWDDYILYLIEKAKVNAYLQDVCDRAIRNCPWSGTLYAHKARLLESENVDKKQISAFFENALTNKQLLSSMEDLVMILLARIDYHRRKIDWEDPDIEEIADLQMVFEESLDTLKTAFPDTKDPYYRIEKYWAYISAKRLDQPEIASEMWEEVVSHHGRDTEAWIHYITFECDQGNYQKCESLFKQAIQKNVDNPARLIDVWTSMEREFGTLESYEQALVRINRKVKGLSRQWQAALAIQEEKNEAREKEKKEKEKRKKGERRMENKKKLKAKKAANSDKPHEFKQPVYSELKKPASDFKKPSNEFKKPSAEFKKPSTDFKKPMKFVKSGEPANDENTSEEHKDVEEKNEGVAKKDELEKEEADNVNKKDDSTEIAPPSRKRKASDGDLQEEDAKKTKVEQRPIKPFKPQPRAIRPNSRRGKSVKLGGTTRVLNKQNAATTDQPESSTTTTAASEEPPKNNDDFRNMLLGKKDA